MNDAGTVAELMDDETAKVQLPPDQPRNIMDEAFWRMPLPTYVIEQNKEWEREMAEHGAWCDGCWHCGGAWPCTD